MRLREIGIALMADETAMFYQVYVTPKDSDYLRYIWWPEEDINKEPEEYQMKVHHIEGVSSPSCASFALRKCVEYNRCHYSTEAVNIFLRHFYVDDC